MRKITIKTGAPVEGVDFFGREKELQYALENYIIKGVSLLLSAPRRVGKTSFAKELIKRTEKKGWKTLYLDLEGISTENELVKLFKEELKLEKWWDKVGDFFSIFFDRIKKVKVDENEISFNDNIRRNNTYRKIKQLINKTKIKLIVIDELTVYLNHLMEYKNDKERVEFFLEWLRNFRQTIKVCWIFCSSVGIENFAAMHQLSKHLNDLQPFPIGEFLEDEAKNFILCLNVGEKVQFTESHIQYILDKLVWRLPYFIQILVDKIKFMIYVESKQLSNVTIEEAYNRLITETHFDTWNERLKEYFTFEGNARKILKLCVLPDGRSREDLLINLSAKESGEEETEVLLSKLLNMLINDGYLAERNGKYIFRSPLLRDFWYARFIK